MINVEFMETIEKPKRKRKLDESIIREGDFVRIINPELFIRVGYPWSKQYVKDNIITEEQREAIRTLLGQKKKLYIDSFGKHEETTYEFDKILDVLSGVIIVQNKFGGKERSIHTERKEHYLGLTGEVMGRKIVKTGRYSPSTGGHSYWGEYDYEPAYLENIKTHVIYKVFLNFRTGTLATDDRTVWIEKKNLEKINEKEDSWVDYE